GGNQRGVEGEREAVLGTLAAARRLRQLFTLRCLERFQFPVEIAGCLFGANQLADAALDGVRVCAASASSHALLNLLQSGPQLVDLLLTLFADDFLIGRTEYEDHS